MAEHLVLHSLPGTRPGLAGIVAQPPLPKRSETPVELPGEDRGSDPSPRPAMKERERNYADIRASRYISEILETFLSDRL